MSRPRYDTALPLSGSRFTATYRIAAETPAAAEAAAQALAVEQTIEFPAELVGGAIARELVARVENLEEAAPGVYAAELSFATELVGGELTQLLNVLFGDDAFALAGEVVDQALLAHVVDDGARRVVCAFPLAQALRQ